MRTLTTAWRATATALTVMAAAGAQATVIDFDGYGVAKSSHSLDFPVNGFVFNTSMDVVDISPGAPSWLSITGPAHSGDYAAANNGGGNSMRSADGKAFSFSSLWVRQYGGLQASGFTVVGLLNGVQVGSATMLSGDNWGKLNANFAAVDTLLFQHDSYWVIDDVLVNASPAPEPSGYAMLLAGLGLAGYAARRRRAR